MPIVLVFLSVLAIVLVLKELICRYYKCKINDGLLKDIEAKVGDLESGVCGNGSTCPKISCSVCGCNWNCTFNHCYCCCCNQGISAGKRCNSPNAGGSCLPPASPKFSIYHIMIDRFNGGWVAPPAQPADVNAFVGGTIKGITAKLDYIAAQGFNVIMLTPVYKGKAYHGYHITDYDTVDPSFGDWRDFDNLVSEVHKRGMKIICDFVPNHCHIDNRIFKNSRIAKGSHHPWFLFDNAKKDYVTFLGCPDLPKFNLNDRGASDFMISVAKVLALKNVDGIRIDHTIGVPFDFLRELRCELKRINPDIIVFGEVVLPPVRYASQLEFASECRRREFIAGTLSQETVQADYTGVLDGVLDFVYSEILIDEIRGGRRLLGNCRLKQRLKEHFAVYPRGYRLILFLDNHDVDRFMFHCNGDRSLLDEALLLTESLGYDYCVYYGTEQYMVNTSTIVGRSYGDLDVRMPMDWR